jgi:hypothetical protein
MRFKITCLVCGAVTEIHGHTTPWACPKDSTHRIRVKKEG